MYPYVRKIVKVYEANGDPDQAVPMKKYMKDQFEYLGIKRPARDVLNRPFLKKESRPDLNELFEVLYELWNLPHREYQYFAMDLLNHYAKEPDLLWINDYGHLIKAKSWWDTVDFLAVTMVGSYMRKYPDQTIPVTKLWMDSDNIWLHRTCILFQLKYKKETNFELLDTFIQSCLGSKDFFINKAIGWALREYSKSNPQLVSEYVDSNNLAPLSKREAMKVIERNH